MLNLSVHTYLVLRQIYFKGFVVSALALSALTTNYAPLKCKLSKSLAFKVVKNNTKNYLKDFI